MIIMSIEKELRELADRYSELESAFDDVQDLLLSMEEICLPNGIEGSHHAEMEWSDTLCQIEEEMTEIQDRLN